MKDLTVTSKMLRNTLALRINVYSIFVANFIHQKEISQIKVKKADTIKPFNQYVRALRDFSYVIQ